MFAVALSGLGAGLGVGTASAAAEPVTPAPQAAATCRPFPDVTSANPHCRSIEWLAGEGITQPVGGKYLPKRNVTRGSMATFLHRFASPGEPIRPCTTRPFPDVPISSVHCGAIAWAAHTGIAAGYRDGTYRPDATVTRGAMATFLYRLATDHQPVPTCTVRLFRDVPIRSTHCGSIQWLSATRITTGTGDGSRFQPKAAVTRASMATFLMRMAELPSTVASDSAYERPVRSVAHELLSAINRIRAQARPAARPVTVGAAMEVGAFCRSVDQAVAQRMSHGDFAADPCPLAGARAENVAAGYATPAAALEEWRTSPGHYRNIVNPKYTQVAVAVAYSDVGRPYYTMLLR